ncbi:MAG: hypothetical protein MJ059_06680 [Lachnospiraceae bacterium]|nr:hypothetical protein [Lachnospiraceae bacterium]
MQQIKKKNIRHEADLTFRESMSIVVGHGVGAGILAAPYVASQNSLISLFLASIVAYCINYLLHLFVAELSLRNDGAQIITCLRQTVFSGKMGGIVVWVAFVILGLSEFVKGAGFITGAAAALSEWFGIPDRLAMIIYYLLAAAVVFRGMKFVGLCEQASVYTMIIVIGVLGIAVVLHPKAGFTDKPIDMSFGSFIALYSMLSFSLSSVMSVPQVVKGLEGDVKKIRGAIASGTGINACLILLITVITLYGTGGVVTEDGAMVDLARNLGGWVKVVGLLFTLLAVSTSFWACTLNLRDIIAEKLPISITHCFALATVPCLILAITGMSDFVGLTRLSGMSTVIAGLAIIPAFLKLQNDSSESPICGKFFSLPYGLLIAVFAVIAAIGAAVPL